MSEAQRTVLDFDATAATDVIVLGLQREVERTGFTRVVLGLSGGLDSAVVAHLCQRAFGKDQVLALLMPYRTSAPDSQADAQQVAQQLGIEARVLPISAAVDAYFDAHAEASPLRRGNKMARERMSVLYDVSAAEARLVIGTSNKTELLLGYTTLFGDSACAIMPIGDLYKTQVRALARHLGVAAAVLAKPPSADLWVGQTDEREMGFTYAEVDLLLYYLVDRRRRSSDLPELGFSPPFIQRVVDMVKRSQYKRKLPVILKLSGRTVDKDFLYPRDWTG